MQYEPSMRDKDRLVDGYEEGHDLWGIGDRAIKIKLREYMS